MPPPPRTTVFESLSSSHANDTRGEKLKPASRQKILPVIAQARREGEAVVDLELVLNKGAHLLLVIDEAGVAAILREPEGRLLA